MTTIRIAHHPFAIAAPGKALHITLWTLQGLVALAFVAAAAGKLLGSADMIRSLTPWASASGSDTSPECLNCWARSCSSSRTAGRERVHMVGIHTPDAVARDGPARVLVGTHGGATSSLNAPTWRSN